MNQWISTGQANKLVNIGICDRTFREKFRECLRWKLTPGGHIRWSREDVESVAVNSDQVTLPEAR